MVTGHHMTDDMSNGNRKSMRAGGSRLFVVAFYGEGHVYPGPLACPAWDSFIPLLWLSMSDR